MKIALAQMRMTGNVQENLEKSLKFCDLAEDCDLLFFPEIQLSPFFPQYEKQDAAGNTTTCIEETWKEFPSYTQYEVRSALAKCGLTTKNIESQVRVLSGGEQAKVRLCKLMNRETNVLLLDEPTNHLDVDAKDELKRALQEYKGAVLLICHEPEFYDGLVSKVWDLSKWSLKI